MGQGYFAVGAERISKPLNLGTILRTANAFGASFTFTIEAEHRLHHIQHADTSKSAGNAPFYMWDSLDAMVLPHGCVLVGVELTDEAVPLPSFRHPKNAAYLVGPERGSLSPEALAACEHVVKIPTHFCINVAVATAVVLYDRVRSMGTWPPRPVRAGGPPVPGQAPPDRTSRDK